MIKEECCTLAVLNALRFTHSARSKISGLIISIFGMSLCYFRTI